MRALLGTARSLFVAQRLLKSGFRIVRSAAREDVRIRLLLLFSYPFRFGTCG